MTARRAFITGLAGQDGSLLAERLVGRGYQVHGLVRDARRSLPVLAGAAGHVELVEGDISHEGTLERALRLLDPAPDEVFHLASASSVARSWEDPAEAVRVETSGTAHLLEAVRRHAPRARVVLANSCEIFGAPSAPRQDEDAPIAPVSPYGAAKACSLWLARAYRDAHGLHVSCAVLFSHESPRRAPHFVSRKVSLAVAEIAAGRRRELRLGNLDAMRDWGAAEEYVDAMWRMAQQAQPGDLVIGSGRARSVRDLCDIAFRQVGLDYRDHVRSDPALFRPRDPATLVADPSRAAATIGWAAASTLEDIVRRMVESDLAGIRGAAT